MGRSTKSVFLCALIASAFVVAPQRSQGLVVDGPALPMPPNSWVGMWNDSSGVAIGAHWVVSAAHVGGGAGTPFVMRGVTYTAKAVYYAPAGTDLMLIETNERLPGWHVIADTVTAGVNAEVCGFGFRAGEQIPLGYLWGTERGETWGANRIDYVNTNNVSMRFDRSDQGGIPGECGAATYDSGGGVFVRTSTGALRLVGVISSISGSLGTTAYGNRTYAVNITAQDAFVNATLGDPCIGDANADGHVDSSDMTLVLSLWGQAVEPFTPGDGNGDGVVDFGDVLAVLTNWGSVCD